VGCRDPYNTLVWLNVITGSRTTVRRGTETLTATHKYATVMYEDLPAFWRSVERFREPGGSDCGRVPRGYRVLDAVMGLL
jgi:hypothetical protein